MEFKKFIDPDQLRGEIEAAGLPYRKGLFSVTELWDAVEVEGEAAEDLRPVLEAHRPARRRLLVAREGAGPELVMDALGRDALASEGEVGRVVVTVPAEVTEGAVAAALDSYTPPAPPPTADDIIAALARIDLSGVSTLAGLKTALRPAVEAAAALVGSVESSAG